MSTHQVKYVYDRISPEQEVTPAILVASRSASGTEVMEDAYQMISNLSNRSSKAVLRQLFVTYIVDIYDLDLPEGLRNQKIAVYGVDSLGVRGVVDDYFDSLGYGRHVKYSCYKGVFNDAENVITYSRSQYGTKTVKVSDLVDLRDNVSKVTHNKVFQVAVV